MTRTLAVGGLVLALIGTATPQFAAAQSGYAVSVAGIIAPLVDDDVISKRRKPRIPGGSGCDDPRDVIEHAECRA